MGSPCEVLTGSSSESIARDLCELVAGEVWRIEAKFSRYLDGNIIHQINSADGTPVHLDAETVQLIEFTNTLHELSDGLFDITSGVLRQIWQFDGSDAVPSQEAIAKLLPKIGWERATWQDPSLQLQPGMEIDLGGIGKEYAVDRCVSLIRQSSSTPCLVNLGGDLAVTGPPANRSTWIVGVEAFRGSDDEIVLELQQGAIATSGDSRRFLAKDGIRYSHVLNPKTGWSVDGAAASITVVADTCVQAGMLSTLAMLCGRGAEEFLDKQAERSWCRR